jgi:hypothetical protein
MATGAASPAARSSGKLCAFRSCITSIPRFARFNTSAQVLTTRPCESMMLWLKLNLGYDSRRLLLGQPLDHSNLNPSLFCNLFHRQASLQ